MQFTNIFLPSDVNGTGQWRGIWPIQTIWALGPNTNINNSITQLLTTEQRYYQNLNMFMVQRLVNEQQEQIFNRLIVPMSEINAFWTVYNIDDAMHCDDIVKYNRGRRAFLGKSQENIQKMLNNVDFVLTTTDYIKNYYNRRYNVPLDKIITIPNYLPRWWIGDYYDKEKSLSNFKNFKRKPRIGIVSSLSHYNVEHIKQDPTGCVVWEEDKKDENGNVVLGENGSPVKIWKNERGEEVNIANCKEVPDDLDLILDCILKTIDEFQWVFFGYAPPKLKDLIEQRKIEYHGGISILNYPAKLHALKLNAIVAPIRDEEFNRCKSNIKWLEASAIGVPLFAQNIDPTYAKYMPKTQLFDDSKDLYDKLMKMKYGSIGIYEKMIEAQWRFLNSPHEECGIKSPNWWLEDNIGVWIKFFSMRKKPQSVSLNKYIEAQEQMKRRNDPSNFLFNNDNGIEIIK